MKPRLWPLRLRITVGFAAGMAVVLAALGFFLVERVGDDLLRGIDMQLRSRGQVVLSSLRASGADAREDQGLVDPDEAFAQVLTRDGRVVDSSSGVAGAPMLSPEALRSVGGPTFLTTRVRGVDDPARLLAIPARDGRLVVVVGATLGDRNEALGRLALALAIGGPVALLLVSWAGWALAGAALRPVERMRREAAAISMSEPERRLPVPAADDEIARLGSTLNDMLGRLQESFEQQGAFLDRASHELRTPLTVLRMELDLALRRARTPEELRSALEAASAETDRLVRLAEDLLVLSRARRGRLALHRTDTSLGELLERTEAAHRARAEAGGVEVRVECAEGLTARVDPERLRQALDDLLDNALRHASPGGAVTLAASRRDGRVRLSVQDAGPGFPPEVLRGDGAAPSVDGFGLGLDVVRATATAHGGELVLTNPTAGGARAELDLPG